jgi:hypothetical protein
MRLNDKNLASFAVCSSPVDKEGYLQKKGDLNRDFQRRWFVLKGNLLFYFQKKQDREPQGVIILEACSVQVSIHGRYCFEISFDGAGTRVYVLGADNDDEMQLWMKAISHASYEYLKSIVNELQRRVNLLSSSSAPQKDAAGMEVMNVGHVVTASGTPRQPPKTATVLRDTNVTLQELHNPIAPQASKATSNTRIKKGILVDVSDDEAPPIPPKKSLTIHGHGSRVGGGAEKLIYTGQSYDGGEELCLIDGSKNTTVSSHSSLVAAKSLPPTHPSSHSSPLVPNVPIANTTKPLSPPSTLDRTPVLLPSPLSSPEDAGTTSTTGETSAPRQNGAVQREGIGLPSVEPSSHPPLAPKKLAAPLDPSKSFLEMHENFTQAMKALNIERTGTTNPPP